MTRIQASKPASFSPGKRIGGGIKAFHVAEHVAEGVAQFAIGFGETFGNGVGEPNVFGEIDGGDPEAKKIGAIFLDDFFGLDDVAEGLVTWRGHRRRVSSRG